MNVYIYMYNEQKHFTFINMKLLVSLLNYNNNNYTCDDVHSINICANIDEKMFFPDFI